MKASSSERNSSFNTATGRLAQGLGWFGIGLGLAQLIAPNAVARLAGIKCPCALLRLFGLREIISGVGILSGRVPVGWLWTRVAGDAMDLRLLGSRINDRRSNRSRVEAATAAVLGVTALDVYAATMLRRSERRSREPLTVHKTITINRPAEELFAFWRDFHNLPQFMRHLTSVWVMDEHRSHWVAKAPAGMHVEWDAEITDEIPGQMIEWCSLPGADVENSGSVSFETAPGDRGTIVRVQMWYHPPAGHLGATVAKLLGESPDRQIAGDLFRFKQLMETGQITSTEGQPAGRPSSTSPLYDDLMRR